MITISTHPAKTIINDPSFTVDTSLTEGASFQNLRIRATIYKGGQAEAVAVLEQPDGLNDFDFFDLLKSLTGKCNVVAGGSDFLIQPTLSAELLTGWIDGETEFDTFTTSGRTISSAIEASSNAAFAASNDLGSFSPGDIIIIGIENGFNNSGGENVKLVYTDSQSGGGSPIKECLYAGLDTGELQEDKIYFILVTASEATPFIALGNSSGDLNFNIISTIKSISDYKNNPGVFFSIKFEEVYENASDVTTIGDESWSDALLFVPTVLRPEEDFDSDYLMDVAANEFLTRTDEADQKYKFGIGMEMRIMFVSNTPYIKTLFTTDVGTTTSVLTSNAGWGILVISDNATDIDAEDENIIVAIQGFDPTDDELWQSESITINTELNCHPDLKALSFVGDLGEETVVFRGLLSESGAASKSYYRNQNRVRKVLKAYKFIRMLLRTLYESEEAHRLLHELIYTEKDVWMYDSDFTDNYREVTVVTDEVQIENQKELIESEIEVEYYN